MLSAALCTSGGASWAQAAQPGSAGPSVATVAEPLPPRFVRCQREVAAQAGDRQSLMRTCLARRLEGERVVQRDCKRQVSGAKGVHARQAAQLACERQALSVVSTELPRASAPAPRPVLAAEPRRPAATGMMSVGTATLPASGEN